MSEPVNTEEGEVDRLRKSEAELKEENANLSDRNADLNKKLEQWSRNIAPWEPRFYAGIGILIGVAFLFFHMTLIITLNETINGVQVTGIAIMSVAIVAVVGLFFWFTSKLRP